MEMVSPDVKDGVENSIQVLAVLNHNFSSEPILPYRPMEDLSFDTGLRPTPPWAGSYGSTSASLWPESMYVLSKFI